MIVDSDTQEIILDDKSKISLYTPEGFKAISDLWLKVGWDQKYLYGFTWMGRPIIQLPDDMIRMQELIYSVKPDVIIETGIAHGGSLIFYASLLKAINIGHVIGVDIEIRSHNLRAINEHGLSNLIDLIEGCSTEKKTLIQIEELLNHNDKVIVILDSAHDYNHVLKELKLYSKYVSVGSYIVVTDGSQEYLHDTPRAKKDYPGYADTWETNNPKRAAEKFSKENSEFEIVEPEFPFNEGNIDFRVTLWPTAFLKRV
jgi:cephalosporin hydroxylase